jgi:hypothetical protein
MGKEGSEGGQRCGGMYAALFSEFPFAKFRARPTRRSIAFVSPLGPGATRDDIWSLSSHSMNPPGSNNKHALLSTKVQTANVFFLRN